MKKQKSPAGQSAEFADLGEAKTRNSMNAAPSLEPEAARKEWLAQLPRLDGGQPSAPLGDPIKQKAPHAAALVGRFDLSLADAQAACGKLASARGQSTWPKLLMIGDAVALQRPCRPDDEAGRNRQRALGQALAVACDLGELASSRAVAQIEFRDRRTGRLEGVRDDVVHHITAADFLVWLTLQSEDPSAHVRSWLRASESASEPMTWAQVAAARRGDRRGQTWSNEEKSIARAEFHRRSGWRKTSSGAWQKLGKVAADMAKECGYEKSGRSALDRVLGSSPDAGGAAMSAISSTLGQRSE